MEATLLEQKILLKVQEWVDQGLERTTRELRESKDREAGLRRDLDRLKKEMVDLENQQAQSDRDLHKKVDALKTNTGSQCKCDCQGVKSQITHMQNLLGKGQPKGCIPSIRLLMKEVSEIQEKQDKNTDQTRYLQTCVNKIARHVQG